MKIQVISLSQSIKIQEYENVYSNFDKPKTFDSFDVNIINLQSAEMWRNKEDNIKSINNTNDFKTLQGLIESSKKAQNIIFLPKNYTFLYDFYTPIYENGKYYKNHALKDEIYALKCVLGDLLPQKMKSTTSYSYDLAYEQSQTKCGNSLAQADFYFSKYPCQSEITLANDSQKPTTIKALKNCFITTLDLKDVANNFKAFLCELGILGKKEVIPQWLIDFECFNDKEQKDKINANNKEIEKLSQEITQASKELDKNLRYKSILIENGGILVDIVFEILQQLFEYDLSDFKDEKKEDFLIKLPDISFIGEIKGITSNVRSENVSQLDNHYNAYLDKLEEEGRTEKVKALLIINTQRNKPIMERDEVHENQIKLAVRNGSLIIPTFDLLKIYEQYIVGKIKTENIIEQFKQQIGLIDISKI